MSAVRRRGGEVAVNPFLPRARRMKADDVESLMYGEHYIKWKQKNGNFSCQWPINVAVHMRRAFGDAGAHRHDRRARQGEVLVRGGVDTACRSIAGAVVNGKSSSVMCVVVTIPISQRRAAAFVVDAG